MPATDLCFVSAADLVKGYRARRFSPLEVTQAVLARIRAVNPRLNAFVTVDEEGALRAAKAATRALGRRRDLPALHGVPVSIKDLTPTKGIRTTWGSKVFENFVPAEDAVVVERLKAAGAIVLGKTNTPEFGAGAHTFNAVFGVTRNPWNPALSPGGSSGGAAAALAAGMGPIAQGSDLGGSLRTPAAFCGVVGFRCTPGLVPYHPTQVAFFTLSVAGPMARTVADAALMLSAIAGPDDRDPLSYEVDAASFRAAVRRPSVKGWRVAWTPDLGGRLPMEPEIARVAEGAARAFRALGARVETACPDFAGMEEIIAATRGLGMVAMHADKLPKWRSAMQEGLVWNIERGLALTPQEIGRALVLRTELWQRVRAFMERHELMILPTTSALPFPVAQPYPTEIAGRRLRDYTQWFHITYAISLTGLPAISVPCGFTASGLPVGLQIVGRRRREADVLRAAAAFEAARPWAHARPGIVKELGG
jgi:amidase